MTIVGDFVEGERERAEDNRAASAVGPSLSVVRSWLGRALVRTFELLYDKGFPFIYLVCMNPLGFFPILSACMRV